jgi:hypothetical protein
LGLSVTPHISLILFPHAALGEKGSELRDLTNAVNSRELIASNLRRPGSGEISPLSDF